MNHGQVIDSYNSRNRKLVTIWDLALEKRFTVEDAANLQMRDLVAYEMSGLTGKCPESGVTALHKISALPPGLKPLI